MPRSRDGTFRALGPSNALGRDPSRVGARSPGPATPRERQIRTSRARPPTTSGARRTRTASPRATVSRDARDAYAFLRTAVRDLSWLARDCRDGNSSGSKNLTGHRGTLFRRCVAPPPLRTSYGPRAAHLVRARDSRTGGTIHAPSTARPPSLPPPPRARSRHHHHHHEAHSRSLSSLRSLSAALPARLRRLRPSVFVRRRPSPIITHPRRHHRGVAMISRRRLRLLGDARRRVSSRKTFPALVTPGAPRRTPRRRLLLLLFAHERPRSEPLGVRDVHLIQFVIVPVRGNLSPGAVRGEAAEAATRRSQPLPSPPPPPSPPRASRVTPRVPAR